MLLKDDKRRKSCIKNTTCISHLNLKNLERQQAYQDLNIIILFYIFCAIRYVTFKPFLSRFTTLILKYSPPL